MIKVISVADLHGFLPDYSELECDVFCICGDTSPLKNQHKVPQMISWFTNQFLPWAESLKCDKVLIIGGNHDKVMANCNYFKELFIGSKVKYLQDESYTYNDKVIYGTPWCSVFGDWYFMLYPEGLKKMYTNIPNNVDLLLTHDVPYGCNDVILDSVPWADGSHIGNKELYEAMIEKNPKNLCCGHLHSTSHTPTKFSNTMCYNCSIVDEKYQIKYNPQIFEI
jgi:Icc-related predicted phosphoesterase